MSFLSRGFKGSFKEASKGSFKGSSRSNARGAYRGAYSLHWKGELNASALNPPPRGGVRSLKRRVSRATSFLPRAGFESVEPEAALSIQASLFRHDFFLALPLASESRYSPFSPLSAASSLVPPLFRSLQDLCRRHDARAIGCMFHMKRDGARSNMKVQHWRSFPLSCMLRTTHDMQER